ncbi:branched-chain amino acid ABC transporter permease [Rhodalgimonas zhirmunskyi]|uniref:Branched-chain amino acid ABC transporter permease n=1 Tax=Rhodalgimonas zhirmunskyi TaxID=2964767 RepID=A0AAJ1UCF7_9RHOB|nr:branched-chain amino acid ABC transporter permease [Rhodoalgimonas zhirmunskyi]MDQ2093617.1 branched-chain amino acid ABC transporter permease [Rhodoalgimonas zhirmunskyi]
MEWVNAIVQGILLGGLYALFAAGLSLMFGIMRFVNLAHGDFIVAAAFGTLLFVDATGVNPLWALLPIVPIMMAAGYVGQRLVLNRLSGKDILPSILVTFGLSIILQNLMLEQFSADSQRVSAGALDTSAISLGGGLTVGTVPFLLFLSAIGVIAVLNWIFAKTAIGRQLRATSDDPETVGLMGLDKRHLFGIAMALASAVVAVAGVLLAIKTNFDPAAGPIRLLFAFEAVIIGGLGSLWGTLLGGVILGVAQGLGAQIDPGMQILAGHIVFLVILVLRPQGLFPTKRGS